MCSRCRMWLLNRSGWHNVDRPVRLVLLTAEQWSWVFPLHFKDRFPFLYPSHWLGQFSTTCFSHSENDVKIMWWWLRVLGRDCTILAFRKIYLFFNGWSHAVSAAEERLFIWDTLVLLIIDIYKFPRWGIKEDCCINCLCMLFKWVIASYLLECKCAKLEYVYWGASRRQIKLFNLMPCAFKVFVLLWLIVAGITHSDLSRYFLTTKLHSCGFNPTKKPQFEHNINNYFSRHKKEDGIMENVFNINLTLTARFSVYSVCYGQDNR